MNNENVQMIEANIDGIKVEVPKGTTILDAAKKIKANIPTLCYHPFLSTEGACRICVVEVEGMRIFPPACATELLNGMVIHTHSNEIRRIRHDIVELLLDNHPKNCLTCVRGGNCELQELAYQLGVRDRLFEGERKLHKVEDSSVSVIRDPEKCVKCRRCIRVCSEIQGVHNLQQLYRGVDCVIAPAFEDNMDKSVCIECGQCVNVCPTAALQEKNDTKLVWEALEDPEKFVVVQTAPAIRAAIGEGWNIDHNDPTITGKLVSALKRLGFNMVFDTNFTADLTIIEEANEFITRVKEGKNLPLITSCSPGWVNFLEHFYPEFIPNTSTCKSPMQMLSTVIKTYLAGKIGVPAEKIFVVSIMPCTAKKFEAKRPEHYYNPNDNSNDNHNSNHNINNNRKNNHCENSQNSNENAIPYTDVSLTTRELMWMIKSYGIDFATLEDIPFDNPFGESSGAADIFGSTGGVMEAALRTAVEKITGETVSKLEYEQVRAVEGLREATLNVGGMEVNIAVANGLNNAKTLLEKVKSGEKQYHLIEIMACPGGCIAGGGQPYFAADEHTFPMDPAIIEKRRKALYQIDAKKGLRKSHENPAIERIYSEFLGEPGSETAHKLLHTHYHQKEPRGIK